MFLVPTRDPLAVARVGRSPPHVRLLGLDGKKQLAQAEVAADGSERGALLHAKGRLPP
jgi:hypothetical protein